MTRIDEFTRIDKKITTTHHGTARKDTETNLYPKKWEFLSRQMPPSDRTLPSRQNPDSDGWEGANWKLLIDNC